MINALGSNQCLQVKTNSFELSNLYKHADKDKQLIFQKVTIDQGSNIELEGDFLATY